MEDVIVYSLWPLHLCNLEDVISKDNVGTNHLLCFIRQNFRVEGSSEMLKINCFDIFLDKISACSKNTLEIISFERIGTPVCTT